MLRNPDCGTWFRGMHQAHSTSMCLPSSSGLPPSTPKLGADGPIHRTSGTFSLTVPTSQGTSTLPQVTMTARGSSSLLTIHSVLTAPPLYTIHNRRHLLCRHDRAQGRPVPLRLRLSVPRESARRQGQERTLPASPPIRGSVKRSRALHHCRCPPLIRLRLRVRVFRTSNHPGFGLAVHEFSSPTLSLRQRSGRPLLASPCWAPSGTCRTFGNSAPARPYSSAGNATLVGDLPRSRSAVI